VEKGRNIRTPLLIWLMGFCLWTTGVQAQLELEPESDPELENFEILFKQVLAQEQEQEDFRILYGPYLQQMSENEVTVMWITNRKAVSWVELAPDDDTHFYSEERPRFYQSSAGRRSIGTVHTFRLTGLKKATAYRYRIYSTEVTRHDDDDYVGYGRTVASKVYQRTPDWFKTFDFSKPEINFTVVNDIHEHNDLLTTMLGNIDQRNPDFVIFNGDMCSTMKNQHQVFEGFMTRSIELFASHTPFFYARGNHETRGRLAYDFLKYFPTPTGEPYYTFRHGPVYFVVLDGGEDKPDNDIEYFGLGDYDRYRKTETEWLKQVVESDEFRQAPYRIVILHIPPVHDDWHSALVLKDLFVPILNRAGIDLMLCGHEHRHLYIPAGTMECNFPVLINANRHAVDIRANGQGLDLKIRDEAQKIFKTLTFPRKF
jgi:predicted phosphodiesterase